MGVRNPGESEKTQTASYSPRARLLSLHAVGLRSGVFAGCSLSQSVLKSTSEGLSICRSAKPQAGGLRQREFVPHAQAAQGASRAAFL